MAEPVDHTRLQAYRGAPFDPSVVDAAVASIRRTCGWHIGQVDTTTAEVLTDGRRIKLPTLCLLEVVSITDGDDPDAPAYTGKVRARQTGVIDALTSEKLPRFAVVEFRHGFETFPDELLPVVADRARSASKGRVTSESLASRSITLESGSDPLTAPMLAAYKLEKGPAE